MHNSIVWLRTWLDTALPWIGLHPWVSIGLYALVYALSVVLLLPAGLFLGLAGGALFGTAAGTLFAVAGATAGAAAVHQATRLYLRPRLQRWLPARALRRVEQLQHKLERDGFNYVLAVRLLPVFPFWLVNLAAPLAGLRAGPFLAATLIGSTPQIAVTASLGTGLREGMLEALSPAQAIMRPSVLLPLLGLALLALAPVLLRDIRLRLTRP